MYQSLLTNLGHINSDEEKLVTLRRQLSTAQYEVWRAQSRLDELRQEMNLLIKKIEEDPF